MLVNSFKEIAQSKHLGTVLFTEVGDSLKYSLLDSKCKSSFYFVGSSEIVLVLKVKIKTSFVFGQSCSQDSFTYFIQN